MNLIQPVQKDEVLIQDVDAYLEADGLHIWWLGQSGYLVQCNGKRILIDPYLSDSLTLKYAGTAKPHVRMSERVVAPELLKNVSVVTSSHIHTDHLDAATLQPFFRGNPFAQILTPEANRQITAERISSTIDFPVGITAGQTKSIHDILFTGIAAAHNTVEKDEIGNCRFLGYVIQWNGFTIYHSGDTLWHEGLVTSLAPFKIDIAFLPINGNRVESTAGNLDEEEAAHLGWAINARLIIPCHYDLFEFNTGDIHLFQKHATTIGISYNVMQLGEGLHLR
jgi:L-ascorbate metabolism protein UlaG (beta-lactamase superfamily)